LSLGRPPCADIVSYAGSGTVALRLVQRGKMRGLTVVARDDGPGITDLARVMEDGYSTSGGLGLGPPGSKRLMDEFDIVSVPGAGTTITMTKMGALSAMSARDMARLVAARGLEDRVSGGLFWRRRWPIIGTAPPRTAPTELSRRQAQVTTEHNKPGAELPEGAAVVLSEINSRLVSGNKAARKPYHLQRLD
jgi:hypothetical protein